MTDASELVRRFSDAYDAVHLPVVLSICLFGIIANLLNVVVLTRRLMLLSPINVLLCGLSTAQLLLLTNFLLYTVYSSLLDSDCRWQMKTKAWLVYLLLTVNMNLLLHTMALVQTTLLAVFRYLIVHYPGRRFVNVTRARRAVACTFLAVPLLCATFFANSEVRQTNLTDCAEWRADWPRTFELRMVRRSLASYNLWFFGVVCKLLPCVCLSVVSALLCADLRRAADRHRRLMGSRKMSTCGSSRANERNHTSITLMLVLIASLFVAVEMPQGLMNVLGSLNRMRLFWPDTDFANAFYYPLGDFFEMMTVLYSSVNFVLICTMSRQFRDTFRRTFLCWQAEDGREMTRRLATGVLQQVTTLSQADGTRLAADLRRSLPDDADDAPFARLTLIQSTDRRQASQVIFV